jgi:ribosome-binding protein aMBF1 (putative translation factor)
MSAMSKRSSVLAENLDVLAAQDGRKSTRWGRLLKADRTLQVLVADLAAARADAGMTQEEVAARMWTTKSVVSRLESGVRTRPTLSTIEKYAAAVGALLEIRVRTRR